MNLEIKTVCFTGHRDIPRAHAYALPRVLERELLSLIERGATVFRAGGAVGFDTVAALKVLELKEDYPQIELELILPCRNQTERWPEAEIRTYEYVLARADRHEILFDRYVQGCMQERNRRLVQGSDVCLAYCYKNRGGTAFTMAHAIKQGLEVVNLYDALSEDLC
ncbi:MAG: DUF1273 domain-containing protein [Ruminococcaceae bacterium]|nr:DUF1273 domain-containing protein [Oscillospiraceae bacterium]